MVSFRAASLAVLAAWLSFIAPCQADSKDAQIVEIDCAVVAAMNGEALMAMKPDQRDAMIHGKEACAQIAARMPEQRQFVTGLNCEDAKKAVANLWQLDPDARSEVYIVLEKCSVAEHNTQHPDDLEATLVAPDPNSDSKIFFKTVSLKDATNVEKACEYVATTTIAGAEIFADPATKTAVGIIDAATDSGTAQCKALLHSAQLNSPFLVVAPSIVTGAAVTVSVLRMIGLKQPAKDIQHLADEIQKSAGKAVAKSVEEVKKNPILLSAIPGVATAATIAQMSKTFPDVKIPIKIKLKLPKW